MPLERAKVLIVDDQVARHLTYEAILADLPVERVRALSGEQALELLLQQQFAAILLDVSMPSMDGFEVARVVRAHPRFEQTPIIFVTGVHVTAFDQLKGYEAGAIDYISVPVVPEILRAKVAVLIELHNRRRELQDLNRELQLARAQLEAKHVASLEEAEAQLRAVFEHPTDLTVVLEPLRDASGAIVDWVYRNANINALNVLGESRSGLLGRRLSEVIPAQVHTLAAMCERVLLTREMARDEIPFKDRDFLVTIFAMGSSLVACSSVDITERKRVTTALRENERRYQALIADSSVGVAYNAIDGRYEYANQAFCDLVGFSLDELRQLSWQELTHPADRAADEALYRRACAGEIRHYTLEKRYVRKDGAPVCVSLFVNFLRNENGDPVQGVVIAVDVTARRAAEEQLRRSVETLKRQQQELRTMLDVVPIAVLVARDPNADDIVGSASFAALTGMPPGENVSQSGPNKDRLPYHYEKQGRPLEPAELPMQQAARLRQVVRDMEMDMVFNDGRVIHLLAQASPLVDDQGNVHGAIGANVDITPQTLAKRALEAADRQKNDFIATLSHELRNPLAPIRYAVGILKRDTSPRSIEHVVRVVDRQAGHMARLLDDLLDLSRITRNAIELKSEPVDLHLVLDSAFENAQPMLQEYGQRLETDIEPVPLRVQGDPARLLQVVDNLLSNACKYTGAGGRITVRARREGDHCTIKVSDTGVGISAQQITGVFTMFGQLDPAMRATKAGLGIGLAISRRLVELHGGTISVRSEGIGKGSTFTITLPHLEHDEEAGDPAALAGEPGATSADLTRLRVLVVDDNIDAADTLRVVLTLAGIETGVAYSAAAAVATAEAMRPDALLLDVGLPDGSGLDVARRIRSTEWGRKAFLVAVTGWGRPEDRGQTAEAGFDTHLVKPVDGDQVLALLAKFVRAERRIS